MAMHCELIWQRVGLLINKPGGMKRNLNEITADGQ